jgi:hypothetical protein
MNLQTTLGPIYWTQFESRSGSTLKSYICSLGKELGPGPTGFAAGFFYTEQTERIKTPPLLQSRNT